MKATSLPNLNRETTSFPNFFTLYQDVDHDEDMMTLNECPNIDHGDDTEASETSPFNDTLSLSLSLSPLVSSNEIGFLAAPRSVMMFRRESEHTTSSVGSNQFSGNSGARSEGTSPAQLWRDRYNHPDFQEHEIGSAFNMREKKSMNPELWQAGSGPLLNSPAAGTHVVYSPQERRNASVKICQFNGCTRGARGASGLCIAHGGGRRCKKAGCQKGAEGKTVFCKTHGGGRRCQYPGCPRSAEGRTDYCIGHGGGRRCSHEGCSRAARGKSGLCIRHGGG